VPPVQLNEAQSPLLPHVCPTVHFGEQVLGGGCAHAPFVHTCEEQSPLLLQLEPGVQMGEQVGAAHRPLTHDFEPQSLEEPRGAPYHPASSDVAHVWRKSCHRTRRRSFAALTQRCQPRGFTRPTKVNQLAFRVGTR
jgi:hypothetical protein